MNFSSQAYKDCISELFKRVKSFQNDGKSAYKPGLERTIMLESLCGNPHRKYKCIHVAGTNGKGSTCNLLASALSECGYKVGLFTSPHIFDFRERARIVSPDGTYRLISEEQVWNFLQSWGPVIDNLGLSFFEITTVLAFDFFASEKVDIAVIETGLGGRLDSTNIIERPLLSIITNIGLDHCDILGETLPEIAFEKAGIIKDGSDALIGEGGKEINEIFVRKHKYSCLSGGELVFAENATGLFTPERESEILKEMDLQGSYQRKNLHTVNVALSLLASKLPIRQDATAALESTLPTPNVTAAILDESKIEDALKHCCQRTGFMGRWQTSSLEISSGNKVTMICDIGHNAHGLKYNFRQLEELVSGPRSSFSHLILVYGSVADKDVESALRLLPTKNTSLVLTNASSPRSMSSQRIYEILSDIHYPLLEMTQITRSVSDACAIAKSLCLEEIQRGGKPLLYVGGSTYVVAEFPHS